MASKQPARKHRTQDIDRQKFVQNVRKVQHRTHCTTQTCLEFIHLFEQYVDGVLPKDFVKADKKLKQAAGIDVIELNGCSACHGHVYGPEDQREKCPCCGASRYDAKGKAQEVLFCLLFCFLNLHTAGSLSDRLIYPSVY